MVDYLSIHPSFTLKEMCTDIMSMFTVNNVTSFFLRISRLHYYFFTSTEHIKFVQLSKVSLFVSLKIKLYSISQDSFSYKRQKALKLAWKEQ